MICSELGAILIVDHCFLVAGVHSSDKICRIWDIVTPSLDWIAIWDTGKTFGFNEDKIGFLITSSEGMKAAIRKSLSVLQFGISRRAKLFFTALFRQANIHRHIEQLRHFCRLNLEMLKDQRCESFCVRDVGAGSLALVDISGTGVEDEEIRELLLKNGVGVVSGNVFFHTDWKKNNYIRIALARDPAYFNEAIEKLLECIR